MRFVLSLLLSFLTFSFAFSQQEGFVTSGEVSIHYKTFGKGQPVLIINGGPGMSSEGFIPLARKIGENYRTILFDQRGTGHSGPDVLNTSTITMDLMLKDMEALRKHLNIDKWVVMGHSFGGMLASYYATQYPDKVQAMILSSSGGVDMELFEGIDIRESLSQNDRDSLAYWSARIQDGDTSYHARLQRGKHLAPAYLYDKSHVPVVAERLTQGNMEVNGLVFQDLRRIGFDCKEALKDFQPPVLIIHGKQDIVGLNIPRKAHDLFPNSELVLLDQCAHYGWLDQREKYFGAIGSFLSQKAFTSEL